MRKQKWVFDHSLRVGNLVKYLAIKLKITDEELLNDLWQAGCLHDIGKLDIPENVLNKPESLTDEERLIMMKHKEAGINRLRKLRLFKIMQLMAGTHETQTNSNGRSVVVPVDQDRRTAGEVIGQLQKRIEMADVVDAIVNSDRRPYPNGHNLTVDEVIGRIDEDPVQRDNFDHRELELLVNEAINSRSILGFLNSR